MIKTKTSIHSAALNGLGAFADLKAHEPTDADFVAKLFGDLGDVFLHAHFGIALHEALVHETIGLVEFLQDALEDFFHGLSRLAFEALG